MYRLSNICLGIVINYKSYLHSKLFLYFVFQILVFQYETITEAHSMSYNYHIKPNTHTMFCNVYDLQTSCIKEHGVEFLELRN